MNIEILSIGRKMPAWLETGYEDYASRLDAWKVSLHEIQHDRTRADSKSMRRIEADIMRARFKPRDHVIALDPTGAHLSSEKLSLLLTDCEGAGKRPVFVIGGAFGLDRSICEQADRVLALSCLTFPHQLVKLIVIEAIYRSYTISRSHPYHK